MAIRTPAHIGNNKAARDLINEGCQEIEHRKRCVWHPELKVFLIVCIDDFKVSGPTDIVQTLGKDP